METREHLSTLLGGGVEATLGVEAKRDGGSPGHVIHAVGEKVGTLKCDGFVFSWARASGAVTEMG